MLSILRDKRIYRLVFVD